MANILGQLLVELGINTAAFTGGLDKATYTAKQFGEELKHGFSELGDSVSELVREFGLLPPGMEQAVGGVLNALGPLTKGVGSVGGALGAVTLAAGAVGISAIGLAVHTAEAAEKLFNLSQATGVSAGTLSSLSLVAGTVGINIDSLAKGLERMGKSAFAAAQAGPNATNAYKTLGIAVTDSSGKMRDQSALFEDVASKFSKLQDGGAKTALAMQLFGRAGAELIPVLNMGGEEIAGMVEHFEKLGAVMTDDVAAAGEKLHQNIELLSTAFAGVQNKILVDLAPALTVFTNQIVGGLEDSSSQLSSFINGIADVAKVIINIFQVLGAVVGQIGLVFKLVGEEIWHMGETLGNVWTQLANGNAKGAIQAIKDGFQGSAQGAKQYWTDAANGITDSIKKIGDVWTATIPKQDKKPGGDEHIPAKQINVDFIKEAVAGLQAQADKEATLAAAMGTVTQATIEANAAAQANLEISKLTEEARKKGIEDTNTFRNAMAAAIPKIQEAATWLATFKAAIDAQKEFDTFDKKIGENIKSLEAQADAGSEVEKQWAKNDAMLVPLNRDLNALRDQYDKLVQQYGYANPQVEKLGEKMTTLTAQYNAQVAAVNRLNDAFQKGKANDEARKLDEQIIKLNADISDIKSGDAFLNVAEQASILKNTIGLTEQQVDQLKTKLEQIRSLQIEAGALGAAKQSGFDPKQMNTLNQEIAYLKSNWQQAGLSEEQYRLTLAKLQAQQADLQAKSGGFFDGLKAGFADFQASIPSIGDEMHSVFSKGFEGITQGLADVVTKGKADWGTLISDMENQLLKFAFSNIFSSILGQLGKIGGGGGGGFFGSILGNIGSAFGGPKAEGGDVTPGKTYLVGEKGPELLKIGAAGGSIVPNGQIGGGMGGSVTVVQNIQTPDVDGFKRSSAQIQSSAFRAASTRHSRLNQ